MTLPKPGDFYLGRTKKLALQAYGLGGAAAIALLASLLISASIVGEPTPPALTEVRFSVAVMAGEKSSAQSAPENADQAENVEASKNSTAPVIAESKATSLPDAVSSAPDSSASLPTAKPVEVAPPAKVSMPGGRLSAEDASVGDAEDPFAIGPRQVFIRLLVDENGKVVRAGIVRSGGDHLRDTLILKALKSRTYATSGSTKGLIRVNEGEAKWQLDMVIPYGTNDFLP